MTKEEIAKKYVPCRCDKAYTDRGMTAPDCPYHSTDPEMAMDEYMKQCCLELLEYMGQNKIKLSALSTPDDIIFTYNGELLSKEELFENFL